MSPDLSGLPPAARFTFRGPGDKERAVQRARGLAAEAGFAARESEEIALVMGELASNALKYGGPEAEIRLDRFEEAGDRGVVIFYVSPVPFRPPPATREPGASLGIGLDVVRNHVDAVRLVERDGGGMRLELRKSLPRRRPAAFGARISALTAPAAGECWNGDGFLVDRGEARVLVAVLDALGHGRGAFEVARAALRCCQGRSGWGVETLLRSMQQALEGSRGIAVAALSVDLVTGAGEYAGVGNVETRWLGSEQAISLVPVPGILGRPGQRIRTASFRIQAPGHFLLASDGISLRHLDEDLAAAGTGLPFSLAARLMEVRFRARDDRTVLVASLDAASARWEDAS